MIDKGPTPERPLVLIGAGKMGSALLSGWLDGGIDPKAVVALVAKATPANGQEVFRACQACHTVEKGGGVKTGPNLFGIVGRKVGGVAGFQYSPDFTGKTTSWTYEELAKFLHNPKGYAPNTKMVFRGVEDPAELADLISYLRSLADSPAPLPK